MNPETPEIAAVRQREIAALVSDDYEPEFDCDALRAAVARLMACKPSPWWAMLTGVVGCLYCDSPSAESADLVTHAPGCPAMAVEAAMREGGAA